MNDNNVNINNDNLNINNEEINNSNTNTETQFNTEDESSKINLSKEKTSNQVKINKDETTLYMILGIIQIFLCNVTTGFIAIILSVLANKDLEQNNLIEYKYKIIATRISLITGFAIGIFVFLILAFIAFMLFTFAVLSG